jgi:hypothetical protein
MSRITTFGALASPAPNDVLPIVDVDDTTMAPTGTTKKITVSNLLGLQPSGDTTGAADPANIQGLLNLSGVAPLGPGTFWVGSAIGSPSNSSVDGRGPGVTTLKATTALGGGIFSQVVASGQSIHNVRWSNFTLDGNTGPSGSNIGIAIDTSASNSTPYYSVVAENVDFVNCFAGWQHAANNASGGPLNNETTCFNCRFANCAMGGLIGGTYSSKFIDCLFAGCTINAVGTSGYNGSPVLSTATGPTTNATVRGCHIEGLGNLTGGGSATESGISLNSTLPEVTDCQLYNISRYPVQVEDGEGLGGVIHGIRCWGSGGTVIIVEQSNNGGGFIAISDVSCSEISQNTGLIAAYGQQGVIAVCSGNATISNVAVAPATPGFGNRPAYVLNLGADGSNGMGIVDVSQLHCSSPGTAWLLINNAQNNMKLKIRNSTGFNPVGVQVVTVPASGTAVASAPYDRMFYITAAAGGCSIAVSGGPTVVIPASALVPVSIPAGIGFTPTYTNPPTWVAEGN